MTLRPGFPLQALGTAVDAGVDLAGLVVRDGSGVVRTGIFPRVSSDLITARSDMKVNIAPFEGVASRSGQGVVFLANDATVISDTIPVPTSNSWITVLWFRQDDSYDPNSDSDSVASFGFTTGNASASPAKPSIPDGAVELATIRVPSTATSTSSSGVVLTNTFQFTAASGGRVLVRNAADRDDWVPVVLSECVQLDTQERYVRKAGVWRLTGGFTPSANQIRPGTNTYPSGSFQSMLGTTIPNAPAGMYRIGGALQVSAAATTEGNVRVACSSAGGSAVFVNSDQNFRRLAGQFQTMPIDWEYAHTGGLLKVDVFDQLQSSLGTVYAGSYLTVRFSRES